jgi:GMP reductase
MIRHIKASAAHGLRDRAATWARPRRVIDLENWGADATKVGIGPGKVCITQHEDRLRHRRLAVVGAQVVRRVATKPIIADGGIRAARRHRQERSASAPTMVMIGSMFAGHEESPGKTVEVDGKLFKEYLRLGLASSTRAIQALRRGQADPRADQGAGWPTRCARWKRTCRARSRYAGGTRLFDIKQRELRDPRP